MLDYKPSINHELNPIYEQMTGFKQKGFLSPLQMIYVYIYIYIYMTFTSSVLHQMTELVQKINEHMHGFKNSLSARITLNKTFLNSSIKDNRCILIFFFMSTADASLLEKSKIS